MIKEERFFDNKLNKTDESILFYGREKFWLDLHDLTCLIYSPEFSLIKNFPYLAHSFKYVRFKSTVMIGALKLVNFCTDSIAPENWTKINVFELIELTKVSVKNIPMPHLLEILEVLHKVCLIVVKIKEAIGFVKTIIEYMETYTKSEENESLRTKAIEISLNVIKQSLIVSSPLSESDLLKNTLHLALNDHNTNAQLIEEVVKLKITCEVREIKNHIFGNVGKNKESLRSNIFSLICEKEFVTRPILIHLLENCRTLVIIEVKDLLKSKELNPIFQSISSYLTKFDKIDYYKKTFPFIFPFLVSPTQKISQSLVNLLCYR